MLEKLSVLHSGDIVCIFDEDKEVYGVVDRRVIDTIKIVCSDLSDRYFCPNTMALVIFIKKDYKQSSISNLDNVMKGVIFLRNKIKC